MSGLKQSKPIAAEPLSAFTILPHDVSIHSARKYILNLA